MRKLNKQDLVDAVSDKTGLTKSSTNTAITALLKTLEDALVKGDTISLVGFGTFSVAERPERTGRNPKTGEQMIINASRTVRLKPGKNLKDQLNR